VSERASARRSRTDGENPDPEVAVDAVVAFLEELEDDAEDDEPPHPAPAPPA